MHACTYVRVCAYLSVRPCWWLSPESHLPTSRYGNNCPETHGIGRGPKYCGEHGKLTSNWPLALKGDVAALIAYNFSAVKLDNPGCGAGSDMQAYYDLVNRTSSRPIVIENCHYNTSFPAWVDRPGGRLACPMSLFRVSGDIKANWYCIFVFCVTIILCDHRQNIDGPRVCMLELSPVVCL